MSLNVLFIAIVILLILILRKRMHKNHSEKIKGGLVNFSGISKSIAKRGGFFSRLLQPRRRKCKKNSKKNTNITSNNTLDDNEVKVGESINNQSMSYNNQNPVLGSPNRINIYSVNNSPNKETYSNNKTEVHNNEIVENLDASNIENEENTPIIVKSEDNYKFKQVSNSHNKESTEDAENQSLKCLSKLDLRENYLEKGKGNINPLNKDDNSKEKESIIIVQKDDWTIV